MDEDVVTAWKDLCQELAPAFTVRTYVTFLHVATAWALCRSRPAVTGLVQTVGGRLLGHAAKHWTSYERFFHQAAWSPAELSRLLLRRVVVPLLDGFAVREGGGGGGGGGGGPADYVDVAFDDTTCGRTGRHVAYAGYFKDASASNVLKKVCHWSHNWVIACVTFRCKRWPRRVMALPVLSELYRKEGDCDKGHPFRTRQQMVAGMMRSLRQALPGRRIRAAADGQYATKEVCGALEAGESLVSRMRSDAALYAPPPKPRPGARRRRGRPRKRGGRLPPPRVMAARRKRGWREVEVLAYGKRVKKQVLPVVCLWPLVCKDKPVKLVIARDPAGKQKDDFFFCTDPAAPEEQVVERAAARWPIEDVVRDAKQHGGMEKVQGWCPRTVERQAPVALAVQTLVKAWYVRHGARARAARLRPGGHKSCPWLREKKSHPSYLDMLATLRCALWEDRLKCNSAPSGRVRSLMKALRFTLCAAQ